MDRVSVHDAAICTVGTEGKMRHRQCAEQGGWQWNRFLMGRRWGEQLFREEVIDLVLLINTEDFRPCLSIRTRANEHEGFRLITWNGAKCSLVT